MEESRPTPTPPRRFSFGLRSLFAFFAGCRSDAKSGVERANVSFDISPDGKQVAFSSADGDLYLFDLSARKVSQLTKTAAIESKPAYSPDGKSIVFVSTVEDRQGTCIFRVLLDGTSLQQVTNDAKVSDWIPTYSPDGSRIAFARAHRHRPYSMGGWIWDNWDVYVMDAHGGNVTRLTRNNYYLINGVTFSPSGQTILFSADGGRDESDLCTNVFEVFVDRSAPPTALIPQPTDPEECVAWASEPDLSSDGKNLVVISDRVSRYHYDLILIDMPSRRAKSLHATSVGYNQQPRFTPDGEHILFLAGRERNAGSRPIFSLWTIDVDGKNAKEIADSQLFSDPHKSPEEKSSRREQEFKSRISRLRFYTILTISMLMGLSCMVLEWFLIYMAITTIRSSYNRKRSATPEITAPNETESAANFPTTSTSRHFPLARLK